MNIQQIFRNNRRWVKSKTDLDKGYFDKLSRGQSPKILYIGCSDSRVPAEEFMGVHPGQVFIYRNIANLVPNTDLSAMSVINYAVEHLKVSHIVVCGHYQCGGVKAAMQQEDLGILNPWLRNIRDVYRTHQEELDRIKNSNLRYKRLIEFNVIEQCLNVLKTAEVQKAYIERSLTVHGWVMDLHSGLLLDLNVDVPALIEEIKRIYRIV
jgi:carbonic anhydrase